MATNTSGLVSSDTPDRKSPPTDLREVIRDMMSMEHQDVASRRLVEKLVSFSSGDVDIAEIGQTHLHLLQTDRTRSYFRIHPQGMEVDQDTGLIYIATVEITEERDHARQYWGKGRAHLFECNIEGKTIRSVNLKSDCEEEYHPSGMVLINGAMFMALSKYAPETSATIIKFNVKDWTYEKLFRIQDHIGLVVPNLDESELLLGTWGTRYYYCTDLKGNIKSKRPTPCTDKMEHQDAQLVSVNMNTLNNIRLNSTGPSVPWADGEGIKILATGVTGGGAEYFGLDIFDVTSWTINASLRWPSAQHLTRGGWPPFANSTFLWVDTYNRLLALATDEQTRQDTKLVLYTLSLRE